MNGPAIPQPGDQIIDRKEVGVAGIIGEVVHHDAAAAVHVNTADELAEHDHEQRAVLNDEVPKILCRQLGALLGLDDFPGVPVQQDCKQQAGDSEDNGSGEICFVLRHTAGHQQVDERQPQNRHQPEQQLGCAEAVAVERAAVVRVLRHSAAERAVGDMIGREEDHVQAVHDGDDGDLGGGRPMADRQPEQDVRQRERNHHPNQPWAVHALGRTALVDDNADDGVVNGVPELGQGHNGGDCCHGDQQGIGQEGHEEGTDHTIGNGIEIVAHAKQNLLLDAQPGFLDLGYSLLMFHVVSFLSLLCC